MTFLFQGITERSSAIQNNCRKCILFNLLISLKDHIRRLRPSDSLETKEKICFVNSRADKTGAPRQVRCRCSPHSPAPPRPAPPRTCVVTTHPCPAKHNIPPAGCQHGELRSPGEKLESCGCVAVCRSGKKVKATLAAALVAYSCCGGAAAGLAGLAEDRSTATRRTRPARRVVVVNQYWPAWPPR